MRRPRSRALSRCEILLPMTTRPSWIWRVGDQALVHRERVTIRGFIDHGGPGARDEVLVEFVASGEESIVPRNSLCPISDLVQGMRVTGEVYLAGGRLDPARPSRWPSPHTPRRASGWETSATAPRSSASPCCCGPRTGTLRWPTTWRSPGRSLPACPRPTSSCPWPRSTTGWPRERIPHPHGAERASRNPCDHGPTPPVSQSPGSSCAADKRSHFPPYLAQAPRRMSAGDGPRPGEAWNTV